MTTWIPGMRTKNGVRIIAVADDGYIEGFHESYGYIVQVTDVEPDTDDTATLACMMMGDR